MPSHTTVDMAITNRYGYDKGCGQINGHDNDACLYTNGYGYTTIMHDVQRFGKSIPKPVVVFIPINSVRPKPHRLYTEEQRAHRSIQRHVLPDPVLAVEQLYYL